MSRLVAHSPVLAPLQWAEFVLTAEDADRAPKAGQVGDVAGLRDVNGRVNDGIIRGPGVPPPGNAWTLWPATGWCGDYAVTKRHELIAAGWPSSALLIAECVTAMGEEHGVLIARMPTIDLVLDILVDVLRPPHLTGYKWIKMQSATDPMVWCQAGVER